MQLKLLSITAAVLLAFAGTAAQAQSASSNVGARADGGKETKPAVDRKARKAEEDRIEADYKAAKAKCSPMKGHEKEVCEADAKGKEKVAKAELEQIVDDARLRAGVAHDCFERLARLAALRQLLA